jgi:hypothetical protein
MSLPTLPQAKLLIIQADEDVTLNLAKLTRIDAGNLVHEYETHPGWSALIASYHADAKIRVMRKENELDNREAEKFFYLKDNYEKLFGGKPTVESLKMAVQADPSLQALREEIVELKAQEIRLNAARESFLSRKDMLISLGAHERAERKTGPY